MKNLAGRYLYILLIVLIAFPMQLIGMESELFSPAIALLVGLLFAFSFENPFPKFNKKTSKYLLQASVVGYGFSMDFEKSLQSGADGMMFTIASVVGVMVIGVMLGYLMNVERKTAYLISSGTAICGGSAIAAVGPVLKASDHQMAVSLGVVFILNAVALFIFPPLGHWAGMSDTQFGTWAAIAIHDTSSVVGAGDAYGQQALEVATLIKLTRALWIIPLALVTMVVFRDKTAKISIPWFIFLFIGAMLVNTYAGLPEYVGTTMAYWAKKGMVLTLFLIGASLSLKSIRAVGVKPLLLAVALWIAIGVSSFFVVMNTVD